MPFEIHTPPWTNLHDINLDWIIGMIQEFKKEMDFVSGNIEDLKNWLEAHLPEELQAILDEWANDGTLQALFNTAIAGMAVKNAPIATGTRQRLIDTFMTYIHHNADLAYMHRPQAGNGYQQGNVGLYCYGWNAVELGHSVYNGPSGSQAGTPPSFVQFTDPYTGNPKVGDAINCSGLVLLCMLGIPYDYSRYNTAQPVDHLNVGAAGYSYNPWQEEITVDNITKYDTSNKLLKRFIDLGLAEPISSDKKNISAGDVLFYGSSVDDITHCSIVLDVSDQSYERRETTATPVTYTPMVLIGESSNHSVTVSSTWKTYDSLDGYIYVGHPQYNYTAPMESELLATIGRSFSNLQIGVANWGLVNSDIITIEADFEPSALNQFMNLQINGTSAKAENNIRLRTETFRNEDIVSKHLTMTTPLTSTSYVNGYDGLAITSLGLTGTANAAKNIKIWRGVPGDSAKKIIYQVSSDEDIEDAILSAIPDSINQNYSLYNEFFVDVTGTTSSGIKPGVWPSTAVIHRTSGTTTIYGKVDFVEGAVYYSYDGNTWTVTN